ncbi:hypothetical protein E2C01_084784 [Portunus trituberculatus]|uniref:Uncharacterized protein n=1 Tax=Portunus trituberculatus TaxID=210409 RepID=A0A5B7JBU6_PORTR|nr:hypothetical protein [Portunus trituberculatus]
MLQPYFPHGIEDGELAQAAPLLPRNPLPGKGTARSLPPLCSTGEETSNSLAELKAFPPWVPTSNKLPDSSGWGLC